MDHLNRELGGAPSHQPELGREVVEVGLANVARGDNDDFLLRDSACVIPCTLVPIGALALDQANDVVAEVAGQLGLFFDVVLGCFVEL